MLVAIYLVIDRDNMINDRQSQGGRRPSGPDVDRSSPGRSRGLRDYIAATAETEQIGVEAGMTSRLVALRVSAHEPLRLARFWADLLGWVVVGEGDEIENLPTDDTGFGITFHEDQVPKVGQNSMHLDLTSRSAEHQQQTVATAIELGAHHLDIGQRPEEGHVVLADPEGNEFCVIGAGNEFLSDCGFVGAVAGDGSHAVGLFWRQVLGWPLVWDHEQETAIRSPLGGPKLTRGGVRPSGKRNRLSFDIAPTPPGNQQAEVARLVSLGAIRLGSDPGESGQIVMADPDGSEFRLLPYP